jgi:HPt (histidine-containing phosphotransfer) domain-containing protein
MFSNNSPLDKDIPLLEFAKKQQLQLRVLQSFLQEQESVAEQIRQACLRHDMQTAQQESHKLRRLLATVGGDSVYPLAAMLEEELRNNGCQETVLKLIEQFNGELHELVQILNKLTISQ